MEISIMNEFLVMFALSAGGLAALYWKLKKTNLDIPEEAEKFVENAKSYRDALGNETTLVIHINPREGVDLPRAGIGHNGGPPLSERE
jgi:hypothetical protein